MLPGGEAAPEVERRQSENPLVHAVVLPLAGYPKVCARRAVGLKTVLFQHPLRCGVVHQGGCFEPVQANIARLETIGSPKIVVHPFAVGEQEETRTFYSDYVGSGIASLYQRDTPDAPAMQETNRVRVRPLDAVIKPEPATFKTAPSKMISAGLSATPVAATWPRLVNVGPRKLRRRPTSTTTTAVVTSR